MPVSSHEIQSITVYCSEPCSKRKTCLVAKPELEGFGSGFKPQLAIGYSHTIYTGRPFSEDAKAIAEYEIGCRDFQERKEGT